MIIAPLEFSHRYASLHPGFAAGFDFLSKTNLDDLTDGRHDIDGDRLFAISAHDIGRSQSGAKLEYHRRYVDIQYVVSGFDWIGWSALADCRLPSDAFDADRDLGFFEDRPESWSKVAAGSFAIYFPEDVHAPLGTGSAVHKVVVKVELE